MCLFGQEEKEVCASEVRALFGVVLRTGMERATPGRDFFTCGEGICFALSVPGVSLGQLMTPAHSTLPKTQS